MRRAPSTFALVLGLVALSLLLALSLAGFLSGRIGVRAISNTYGRLVVATALTADNLSTRHDSQSRQTLETLEQAGVRFSTASPPPPTVRVAPLVRNVGRTVGRLLGDPSRVVVTQTPESQIWIRSAHDPKLWIVLHAVSYRGVVIRSTLLIMVAAGLIALAGAGLVAWLLTRPLERLAAHATELLSGAPMGEQLRGSTREVRHLAHAIGEAGERQQQAARERELMLAGISHDLRTPLARLRLALELGDAGDDTRRAAMVADLDELDTALEQCLAFVREGRDEVARSTDIVTLAGQLLALRREPDDWRLEAPESLLATVRPSLLRRALGNLMDNAERHGAAPFAVQVGREGTQVYVRVSDQGPGVPTELLQRLGQPFLRGNPARGGGGMGLGLSIARRAAQRHGGTLDLRNGPHHGFVATLRFLAAGT